MQAVTLNCHPDTPTDALRGIMARVRRAPGGRLAIGFVLDGDLGRLRVPAARVPRFADGLWRHTCCEVFVARKGSPGYYEFNFSPSREWAAYAFDGYRSPRAGGPTAEALAPEVEVRSARTGLELDAAIALDRIPTGDPGAPLSLALSAVIEDAGGSLSYWALRHPAGKPDFHHREGFALELAEEPA